MTKQQRILFLLLQSELLQKSLPAEEKEKLCRQTTMEDWKEIAGLSARHRVEPMVFEALQLNAGIPVPPPFLEYFRQKTIQTSFSCYQLIALTAELVTLMEQNQISCYVLKGAGLSALYPKEEIRPFSDIDLYVPKEEEFQRACRILEEHGAAKKESFCTYHFCYDYPFQGSFGEVELHWKLYGEYDRQMDCLIGTIYQGITSCPKGKEKPLGMEIPVPPATYLALYLLMHMFQHFMGRGFGIRLLCDWTVFWNRKADEIHLEQFLTWIRQLKLEKFLAVITGICIQNLGLHPETGRKLMGNLLSADAELEEKFLSDLLEGGEFGKWDETRMLITTQKPGIRTYGKELHRQMKRRFPEACKRKILWPVLWLASGIAFLYNNIRLRKVPTAEFFKSNEKRNRLLQEMDIFSEKGGKKKQ